MDLRDRVIARYVLSKRAGQIVDPVAVSNAMAERLKLFGTFEGHLRNLQQGAIAKLKAIRANDPNAIPRGDAKDLLGEVNSYDRMITQTRLLTDHNFFKYFRDMWELSLAILQQFNLPSALRGKIERTAKFWASKQMPKTKRNKATTIEDRYDFTITLYLDQLATVRDQHAAIVEALAKGKPMSEGDGKIKAGPFTLVNTGGFKDEVMNEVATTVQKAASLMTAHGLGKVCYGEILVSKKVGRANVLAFYLQGSDEMFVRAGLRVNVDSVRTVMHELGHRLHRKFLASKDRQLAQLYSKYNVRKMVDRGPAVDPSKVPPVGEEVPYKGTTLVVQQIDWATKKVRLVDKAGGPGRFSVPIVDYNAVLKGETPSADPSPEGFVTTYAGKSPEENFAEMVSFYCLDKLSPGQVADLEAIL